MSITKAFIEENGNGRMETEMRDVYEELSKRNIPTELFVAKRIHRRQLPLAKDTLVVAYVDTFLSTLKILNVEAPSTNDYPIALQPFLYRRIWESTIAQLTDQIYEGSTSVFAKPKNRKKRFTGRVFSHPNDLVYLEGASRRIPIFCSEVIEWLSEYRIFVMQGNIVGIQHYKGDSIIEINKDVVSKAVELLEQSSEKTSAYALDFGVSSGGETALVEWNDAFSIGSYGLDKAIYTDLLITRWNELIR